MFVRCRLLTARHSIWNVAKRLLEQERGDMVLRIEIVVLTLNILYREDRFFFSGCLLWCYLSRGWANTFCGTYCDPLILFSCFLLRNRKILIHGISWKSRWVLFFELRFTRCMTSLRGLRRLLIWSAVESIPTRIALWQFWFTRRSKFTLFWLFVSISLVLMLFWCLK